MSPAPDKALAKRHAPATARNREPILSVLRGILPESGAVLEVGAGSGEHAAFFSLGLPGLVWQPSDLEPENLASIAAWTSETGAPNVRQPFRLDLQNPEWPSVANGPFAAVVAINVLHIAPWSVCEGLMAGATQVLAPGGLVYLYGPFRIDGRHTAPSNASFDESLRAANPSWGVRDVADVAAEGATAGLTLDQRIAMPANNQSLIFRRSGVGPSSTSMPST